MTQEISSLMDGELGPQEAGKAIRAACADSEALRTWEAYHVIGEAMRGAQPHATRCGQRVHEALAKEPAIIARPPRVADRLGVRVALAAAASVATLGIVTWIGHQGGNPVPGNDLASNAPVKNIQPVSNTGTVLPASNTVVDTRIYEGIHRQVPAPDIYVHDTARTPQK